jgi:tetratricopeptide (TPR) repeat protein
MEPNLTIKTPAEWKNYGNKQFVLKQYTEAIQAYTNGLNLCNSQDQDMLANRAAAYINLERYALALNDASAVLSSDQSHEKAIYRKVKSLLGLSRCEEAVSFLRDEIFKSNQRPNKELLDLFAKAESMLDQQMSQVYDVSEYFGETEVRIDNWAEYRGPVEIVHIPGKGRGLLATEDMVQGQLVMAQRAFNILFLDVDKEERFEDSILEHVEVKSNHDFSGRLLVQRVYNKLKAAPEFGDEFYQLYAGKILTNCFHRILR